MENKYQETPDLEKCNHAKRASDGLSGQSNSPIFFLGGGGGGGGDPRCAYAKHTHVL